MSDKLKPWEGEKEKKMSREYRRIYCCGDCVHYSMKTHKCMIGAKNEGSGRESFYRDCPFPIYEEEVEGEKDERPDATE